MGLRLVFGALACLAMFAPAARTAEPVSPAEWMIDGEKRQALIFPPAKRSDRDAPAPVILVFHGHGGTMRLMARKGYQEAWPEAIIVCPQGLPTATPRDPQGKRTGWQMRPGGSNDRDLKFVDAILKTLDEKYEVDDARIFATGHSNGGGFAYLLWRERGRKLAAIAPVAAGGLPLIGAKDIKPLPVMHVAGEKDPLVPFVNQQRTVEWVRKLNGCDAEGRAWKGAGKLDGTLYSSEWGAPVAWVVHPGGHEFPREAPQLIVRFFREVGERPTTAPADKPASSN